MENDLKITKTLTFQRVNGSTKGSVVIDGQNSNLFQIQTPNIFVKFFGSIFTNSSAAHGSMFQMGRSKISFFCFRIHLKV